MALPANIVDLDPVDFCGKQVNSFSEAFWESTFQNPALSELLTVIPGVKAKQQVVILGLIGLVGKTIQTDNCAPDVSDQEIPSVQKFYDPNYIEDRFTECWKSLLDKFTVWGLKNGINKPDLTGTDFANFLEERVIDGLEQSIYRIVWFADKAAANFVNGGVITNGVDIRYINAIDGLWEQFFDIAAANPDQRIIIPNNYGGLATPAKPVGTASTTGGTLAAGSYYVRVSAVNAAGETIGSPVSDAIATTGSTGSISVAIPTIAGATGYRVYVGTSAGTQNAYFAGVSGPIVVTDLVGTSGSPKEINTATTYAGQKFTSQDTTNRLISGILDLMIEDADERLIDQPIEFFVTRSVAQQYKRERKDFDNIELSYMRTETGWDYLEYDGIRIMVLKFEDRMIKQFHDSGVSHYLPHRIYLTTKENLHLATEEEGSMTTLKPFYENKDNQYYIDMLYSVDALVIEDYKVMLAY